MSVRLVVQGDDFGMCHAVNEGIVSAFVDGILTQTTAMVPCPWFDEAVALEARHRIPIAMHSTLTCEWDNLRWRPLTDGPTLRGADGTFHRTVKEAAQADPGEAAAELVAQAERFVAAVGHAPVAIDPHMGASQPGAYDAVCAQIERQFIYPVGSHSMQWTSIAMLSARSANEKLGWLLGWLERREPGNHFLCTHPGVPGPELASIADPAAENAPWAEEYRASDLAALTAPEVHDAVKRLGIELVSISDL